MKFVRYVCLFAVYPFCMMVFGFIAGMMTYRFFYPGALQQNVLNAEMVTEAETSGDSAANVEFEAGVKSGAGGENEAGIVTFDEIESVETSDVLGRLSADTKYIVIENDLTNATSEEITDKLPHKYIGMDREQFLSAMEKFEEGPPLSQREKGFVGLQVLSFSRERVVVRMDYRTEDPEKREGTDDTEDTEISEIAGSTENAEKIETAESTENAENIETVGNSVNTGNTENPKNAEKSEKKGGSEPSMITDAVKEGFYLAVYDDEVIVYLGDQKTVFVGTGIMLGSLPQELQKQIIQMLWVPDEESLFRFLEAYSS